jgi:hypothetical protein
LDEEVCHFAERFRSVFSKPHYQYFVTVLLGLMECEGKRTLSGVLSQVGQPPGLSGLSRFFSEAPWEQEALVVIWLEHFRMEMQPQVKAEREQQRKLQPKRRGRPKQSFVTGYVIGDDSTMSKPKGHKMEGVSKHHSTTYDQRIVGHSLVQGLYVLLDRHCPLAPQLYRQARVCEADYVASLTAQDCVQTSWPRSGKKVYVHVIPTSVRKLYRCQIVIVRHALDARSPRHATSHPVIWKRTPRPCSHLTRPAGTLRCSSAMAKRNWAWTIVRHVAR